MINPIRTRPYMSLEPPMEPSSVLGKDPNLKIRKYIGC